MKRKNEPDDGGSLTRREFGQRVGWAALGLGGVVMGAAPSVRATPQAFAKLPIAALQQSPFVYISPLLETGAESRCHAELWYAWLDESVVVTVASDRWKAKAVSRGLGARIWVGDRGRWKTWYGSHDEGFREAPHFDARAQEIQDPEMLERLLSVYETKYPDEIASWRDKMRSGNADGSRILLRYTPLEA